MYVCMYVCMYDIRMHVCIINYDVYIYYDIRMYVCMYVYVHNL
jgi:hypothetical protein